MALDEIDELPETCANCGKPLAEWTENEGRGVLSGGVTYCSSQCGVEDAARQTAD